MLGNTSTSFRVVLRPIPECARDVYADFPVGQDHQVVGLGAPICEHCIRVSI